jgi:4-hydroxythreonine-4-phosphate dehydrogenase
MIQKNEIPVIISTGDPAGIGPIISVKALNNFRKKRIYLIGDRAQLEKLIKKYVPDLQEKSDEILRFSENKKIDNIIPSEESGRLSFQFFEKGVEITLKNRDYALVTAPISKELWLRGGINYKGHTDYFDKKFKNRSIMFFYSEFMKVALFTHHIPLRDLWKYLKREKIEIFLRTLDYELNKRFKLNLELISGSVNPHAGEEGYLGDEERQLITPVLKKLKGEGLGILGPYPNDTVFFKYRDRKDIAIVSYTHDTGLSPFKLLNFFSGVNMTLNIPLIRTSPDHGTGFDLVNKIDINEKSMVKSIELAINLKKNERK